MHFTLIDHIIEQDESHIVALKQVSLAEEYLQDHFPSFPVLPGVMMIEALAQAARRLLEGRSTERLVLGEVKALKFSSMVRPGEALQVEVTLSKVDDDGRFHLKGTGRVMRNGAPEGRKSGAEAASTSGEVAVSGRFVMRPVRVVRD